MTMILRLLAACLLAIGTAAHAADSAAALIDRAAASMGGKDRLLAVRSLRYAGLGWNANLMQQMRPDSPLLLWMLPTYQRTIDLSNGRMATTMIRRPAFPAVFDNAGSDARIDGTIAWDVSTDGKATPRRASVGEVRGRRLDMYHHPLTAMRAALAAGTILGTPRRIGDDDAIDVTTAAGDRFTLAIDRIAGLPAWVRSMRDHVQLGDVALVTHFSGYEYLQPAGIRLPKRLLSGIDRWPDYDIGVMEQAVNVATDDLVAPPAVRDAAPPVQREDIAAELLAPGLWHLTGAYRLSSLVIEFADHLAILEVPNNDIHAQALFAKARSLRPGKPLTQAIFTHFHSDHAGGFRATVAEGLTIYAHRGNEALFREFARRPATVAPDALARHPRPLKFVAVDDDLALAGALQPVHLLHARGATHGDTMLMAWFPQAAILAQGDLWTPGSRIVPHAVQFAEEIARRGLKVERHVAIDSGQVKPDSDFRAVAARLRTGAIN